MDEEDRSEKVSGKLGEQRTDGDGEEDGRLAAALSAVKSELREENKRQTRKS